jgi:Ca-activated chloride channel family protein
MTFLWPFLLYLLICIPVLLFYYFRIQKNRRTVAEKYGVSGNAEARPVRHKIVLFIFFTGLTILIVSVARPVATVQLPRLEGTVILTFDVSGSMAADDTRPTRMEAAKQAARDFVKKQPSTISIGVVAFSDGGITVQPPSKSRELTLATIERLTPRRGTSLGNGMLVAINSIVVNAGDPSFLSSGVAYDRNIQPGIAVQGWYPSAVIILLTDGENNESPDPLVVTDLAVDLGVRVYAIGVGTLNGAVIKTEGMRVHTRLNDGFLRSITNLSGGKYYYAGDENDLAGIYEDISPTVITKPEKLEVTSILAEAGMALLLLGSLLSLLWFGRAL